MKTYYDVIVIGGGINGVLCAMGLEKVGLSVLVLEGKDSLLNNMDSRVFTFAKKTKDILEFYGVWDDSHGCCPMDHILIYDEGGSPAVHFDKKIVGSEPMGYVVEAEVLAQVIKKNIRFDFLTSATYKAFSSSRGLAYISLHNGSSLSASLVVCAEGPASHFRKVLAMDTISYDFGQSCIVCNIKHEKHHRNTAIENFYPGGPFAILPLQGGFASSIVFTEKTKTAEFIFNSSDEDFRKALEKRCSVFVGNIELINRRKIFNVSMSYLKKQYTERVIFMGDAAHAIHPIAGQGLNVGIREGKIIADILGKYRGLGSDLGQKFILREIEDRRLPDNFSMAFATTLVNFMFSSKSLILKALTRPAMAVVEMSPLLKKSFMEYAMGVSKICE